jgi:hypothetical protein
VGESVTLRVLVVAEDVLGMTLARDLCDRVVVERGPGWLADLWHDVVTRESQRWWGGLDAAAGFVTWGGMKELAQRQGLRTHGLGMSGGAFEAYRTAHAAAMLTPRPDVLVMCRDTDRTPNLRTDMLAGLKRARVEDVPMLLAVARPEAEAWVIAGFEPAATHEREALTALTQTLGFDPVAEPHRMTANTGDARDTKRCCDVLLPRGVHSSRGESCWWNTPLDDLSRRGASAGLPEYLADIERVLLPRLSGEPAPRA